MLVRDGDGCGVHVVIRQLNHQVVKSGKAADRRRFADVYESIKTAGLILLPSVKVCAGSPCHDRVAEQMKFIAGALGIDSSGVRVYGSGVSSDRGVFDNEDVVGRSSQRGVGRKHLLFDQSSFADADRVVVAGPASVGLTSRTASDFGRDRRISQR